MSGSIYKIIPTDPRWEPDPVRAERARDLAARLAPPPSARGAWDVRIVRYQATEFIDNGSSLDAIGCPLCGADIASDWWSEQMSEHYDNGFTDLAVVTPCCHRTCGLDELDYYWPCGFARFEIRIWEPSRDPFTDDELAALGDAIGHPVRQILAYS